MLWLRLQGNERHDMKGVQPVRTGWLRKMDNEIRLEIVRLEIDSNISGHWVMYNFSTRE